MMKDTKDLMNILGSTHLTEFDKFREEELKTEEEESFYVYVRELLSKKNISQQTVFLNADIPERYGYKLLSGEKKTRQRDVILRICYGAHMSLEETQRALRKYQMPELYAKVPRDALLMIIFNVRPGSIIDVNTVLKEHGMSVLRTSGLQN